MYIEYTLTGLRTVINDDNTIQSINSLSIETRLTEFDKENDHFIT